MRVTLKRADFYARAALKQATDSRFEMTTRLSVFAPMATDNDVVEVNRAIQHTQATLLAQIELSLELIRVSYAIRGQLAKANVHTGVSQNLTDDKMLAAEEGRIRGFIKACEESRAVEESAEAALAKAEALRSKTDRYGIGREDYVLVSAINNDIVERYRRRLKRLIDRRSDVANDLTVANVTNHITLDYRTVAVLRSAEILDAVEEDDK